MGLLPTPEIAWPSSRSISLSSTPSARGERDQLRTHGLSGDLRGAAGIDRLAAGERADALCDRAGVAQRHHNVFDAAADLLGHDLRQRGARALALIGGPGRDGDLAALQDAHGDALERTEPGALDIISETDANEPTLLARDTLALAEAFIVGLYQRGFLTVRIIATVIDQRLAVAENQPDFVRHLFWLDEIAAANFGPIELQLVGDAIHQPLHCEHRLRPAGAAHRRGRHLVGQNDGDFELIGRDHIGPRYGCRGDIGHDYAPW